jgi:hypothetical protein
MELYNAAKIVSGNTDLVTNGADVSDAILSLNKASFRILDVPYFHLGVLLHKMEEIFLEKPVHQSSGVLLHKMEEIFLEKPVHQSSDDDDSSDGRGEKEEECIDKAKRPR